jgi:hypothetical protein
MSKIGYSKAMSNIAITHMPKQLQIHLQPGKIVLPEDLRSKVIAHWDQLIAQNPALHNGEVFSIVSSQASDEKLQIELQQTDYAHHLYNKQVGNLGEYEVKIIHPCSLLITADDQLIFGAMGDHTSSPGEILCCGGGIDLADVDGETVHIEHAAAKELQEELDVDVDDADKVLAFQSTYLITNSDVHITTVVYVVRLRQTSDEFQAEYEQFAQTLKARGETPEFGELFFLPRTPKAVGDFLQEHESSLGKYMPTLLQTVVAAYN